MQNLAAPNEQDAMLILPPSRPCIAILKPSPGLPTIFSYGTIHSSKETTLVG